MTVTIDFEPELEQGLRAQAQSRGVTVGDLIRWSDSRFKPRFIL